MTTVNTYLNFNGNCQEAFNFYQSVFGGEFSHISRFKDIPAQEGMPILAKEMEDRIMHVSLPISQETMIMGSDTGGEWAPSFQPGNNFSIAITTDSQADADRLFSSLSAGGQVTMPLNHTFWGDYFGMLTDRFGINWMVSCSTTQTQELDRSESLLQAG